MRFQPDIVIGFYWGSETLTEARRLSLDESSADSWAGFFRGYFALYDRVKREAYENDYGLDYPPLRLLAMSIWAKQVRSKFPGTDDAHPGHVKPLLNANLFCELISAVTIFLLVRLWLRRAADVKMSGFFRRFPTKHRGWIFGFLAARLSLLATFMRFSAHGLS